MTAPISPTRAERINYRQGRDCSILSSRRRWHGAAIPHKGTFWLRRTQVRHRRWRAAISIQGGQAARIDLDLLKLIAFARTHRSSMPIYGVLVLSDKVLLRTITGVKGERAFDYAQRLRRLFDAAASEIADVLVVEFNAPSVV
ncbi:MAG: hypothetical protein KGK34_02440 [Chloroflexota bacterium]|nr:hypothetical protein [Chloroflexota bacterium]